jgi:phosphate-selective porin OprO/OprP
MRRLSVIAALACLFPAVGQATTLEDLLVEKGVLSRGEATAAHAAGASKIYWKKGTRIEFPDSGFTVGITSFLQTRYTFTDNDADSGKVNTSSFSVKRARLIVSGTALNEEFAYKLEGDFVGGKGSDGAASANMKDGYLEWNACDWAGVRLGQFKTNLGRQHLNSDTALQFADRSVVSDYFTLDRQNGAMATSKLMGDELVMTAGIFNGESDGESGPNKSGVDTNHTGIVSLRWNPLAKINAYEEGDVDWSEEMALSFGASYGFADSKNEIGGALEGVTQNIVAVDANMKYLGWSVHAELFNNNAEADDVDVESDPSGFYAQVGYFFDPKTMEVAARYSYLDCDNGAAGGDCSGNDSLDEVTVGLNYYWWKHHLKAQLNYVRLAEDAVAGEDLTTNRWLVQLSATF